jgi:hypothetical protein
MKISPAAPESIPLSALNHHLYCERRAYLIHAERVFVDNEHTTLGHPSGARIETSPGGMRRTSTPVAPLIRAERGLKQVLLELLRELKRSLRSSERSAD